MGRITDLLGTFSDIFQVGVSAGVKTLRFFNGFKGDLNWNPTADRTIYFPDSSGDLMLADSVFAPGYIRMATDFIYTAGDFVLYSSGTNSSVVYDVDAISGRPGIITLNLGTTVVNYARVMHANSGGTINNVMLGVGKWDFCTSLRITNLSTSTETYSIQLGFFDVLTAALPVDGVLFRYTSAENGGRYQCITSNNSVRTTVDSGFSPSVGVWHRLDIKINPTGTSAQFFIDRNFITEITTNIPTGTGRATSVGILAAKTTTAGAGQSFQLDYVEASSKLSYLR